MELNRDELASMIMIALIQLWVHSETGMWLAELVS